MKRAFLAFAAVAVMAAAPAYAHHSFASTYFDDKTQSLVPPTNSAAIGSMVELRVAASLAVLSTRPHPKAGLRPRSLGR